MSNQELMVSDQTYMPAMSTPPQAARFAWPVYGIKVEDL